MKEKILAALKTKYKNLGFGEKALDGVATYLTTSVTEESQIETVTAGVEGLLKMFQSEQDALRGSKTDADKRLADLQKQVEQIIGGKKEPEPPKNENLGDDVPAWAKAIVEQNKKLAEQLNRISAEKITNSRKAQIDELIKGLPEHLKKPYARMNIDNVSDEDFAKQVDEIKGEVESISKELGKSGAVFGVPNANRSTNQHEKGILSEAEIKAITGEKV